MAVAIIIIAYDVSEYIHVTFHESEGSLKRSLLGMC